MSQKAWDVYLDGYLIDTVFYSGDATANEVRKSLIEHDGFHYTIVVEESKPWWAYNSEEK